MVITDMLDCFQNTNCFLESHALFFEKIQGVYRTMVYDNMKVGVKKFIGRTEKEPTDELLKLSLYYGFNFRFCNAYSGNEKGHVERSVDYIRHKAFCDKDIVLNLWKKLTLILKVFAIL